MGLIRKSLAVGTVGVVRPSSKKQRVAKATQRAAEANARQAAILVREQQEANRLAAENAQREHEFRYATDEKYRQFIDEKNAAEERARREEVARIAEAQRLRVERRRARNAAIMRITGRTAVIAAAIVAIPAAAVLVWLPQIVIARVRHAESAPWMLPRLTRPFRGGR